MHKAVEGMSEKETKQVQVPPEDAYGPYYPEWVGSDLPRESGPAGMKVGDKVKLSNGLKARITQVDENKGR